MQESSNKMQEMQILEQNLHNILHQKQAFQIEASETKAALKEIENAGEEVFKVIGQLMIKADKSKMKEDLLNREKILDLRLDSLEKQEKNLTENLEQIRSDVMKSMEK